MKILLYILAFLPFALFSQVGINTTTPEGILDVASTKHGVLFPRVALEYLTQEAPVLNPKGGGFSGWNFGI